MTELLDLWVADLTSEGKSAGTVSAYRIAVRNCVNSGTSTTDQLNRSAVRRWLADSSGYARRGVSTVPFSDATLSTATGYTYNRSWSYLCPE